MGYYVRVLTPSDAVTPFSELQEEFAKSITGAVIVIESGSDQAWDELVIAHEDGREICLVERNPVHEGELGADEIAEFLEELSTALPESGAHWVRKYLAGVKTIYALQINEHAYKDNGWDAVEALQELLLINQGGIIQADFEGFTNEDGFYAVWQFDDDSEGKAGMAVLRDGEWVNFVMDLENQAQRKAFLAGELPPGVKVID